MAAITPCTIGTLQTRKRHIRIEIIHVREWFIVDFNMGARCFRLFYTALRCATLRIKYQRKQRAPMLKSPINHGRP